MKVEIKETDFNPIEIKIETEDEQDVMGTLFSFNETEFKGFYCENMGWNINKLTKDQNTTVEKLMYLYIDMATEWESEV